MALSPTSSHPTFNGGTITSALVIADTNNNHIPQEIDVSLAGINVNMWEIHSTDGGGADLVYVDSGGTFNAAEGANVSGGSFETTGNFQAQLRGDQALGKLRCDSNGVLVGNSATDKVGFFGTTPAVQHAAIADAAGGVVIDAEARAALNTLLATARTLGLIAT